ncbi:hypothetical protein [Streptomyces venezuelae]|uniref:hypothetical protein n=1 Tax=Streptomyces venezuelae TaxID=54571 RepID=UPI001F46B757|nr:hypothetical protein [Streptomyces venezuelae]
MPTPLTLASRDPLALAVTEAVTTGDLDTLRGLLAAHPGLARARVVEDREAFFATAARRLGQDVGLLPRG